MNSITKSVLAVSALAAFLVAGGCKPQVEHPNALNSFDGATYDSMLVAHAALSTLGAQVSTSYPKYHDEFNQAAKAYNDAFAAYAAYRANPTANESGTAALVNNVTVSLVALEDAIQHDLPVSAEKKQAVRARAARIRAHASMQAHANVSIADILTDLEICASIAQAVPQAAPYAALAQVVISATQSAVSAYEARSGTPIDLSLIQPIALLA